MKIITAEHCGFCYGVRRAVELAEKCKDTSGPVATLGPIIHNPQVVERLQKQGVGVAASLNEFSMGTVVIRSHGVGPSVYQEAESKGLTVVDATCPHVQKAQQAAARFFHEGRQVIIIGEHRHPEVQSILEWAQRQAKVVENKEEAESLPEYEKIGVVSQTTFATDLFTELVAIVSAKSTDAVVDRTICAATEQRQQAALQLAAQAQVIIVVGGKNSANTNRLADLCTRAGTKVYHIETAEELQPAWFIDVETAGVTAGASTPDWIIEEVCRKMQDFNEMLAQTAEKIERGMVIKGTVVGIRRDEVFVDIGYKAEGVIPLKELAYPAPDQASDVVKDGEEIDVYVLNADNEDGQVLLSKRRADEQVAWNRLEEAMEQKSPLQVTVTAEVKGGLSVAVFGIRGFIPASHIDLRFVGNLSEYIGQTIQVVPIEIERGKKRIVLSRKMILENERKQKEEEIYGSIEPNQVVHGVVRRLTDFGAFVDIGGVDGLIHISDLSWHHVKSPQEVVQVGDEVDVLVLKVDAAAKRISLSLKQTQRDPWMDAVEELQEGMLVKGVVTKLMPFGAFVKIHGDIEGLVHISEMAEQRVNKPEEVVSIGQEVVVKVIRVEKEQKRIGLSISQAQQETERAEFSSFIDTQAEPAQATIGERLAAEEEK
ncbi:bifunctional 4-hydroxy-3-methylbut-2-enyl diphosphate reductase/30S ribosomal protein S1 [Anaeromusa acidaminophila]|uniref:bifunctional 4-hydroxy-3-methylbut-2-enyl diphosphate reductase/30S ribosomal protein S1 n=1 Tax=Anaeromusa acidaminophila TaxID=81464 RepID=UPI0003608B39|nr:bifunctional 4-hydroxy-3-methylbut-2-enyl diphosphate reductase/30S ribosomal protein S1 [Anaeromusa acidaminophila]